jgi:hypothetical protein
MSEVLAISGPGGIRRTTAITSAATTVFDLRAFVGQYVEVYADQAVVWGFSDLATDALTVSGEVGGTAPGNVRAATYTVGRPLASGTWLHRMVSAWAPYLQVRASSTSTGLFIVAPASERA